MPITDFAYFEELLAQKRYETFCSVLVTLPIYVLLEKNSEKKSLLHLLASIPEDSWRNMVLSVVNHDCLASVVDGDGNLCIHLLVERGYASSVAVLRKRMDAKMLTVPTNNMRDNVFHIVARLDDSSTLRELLLTPYHPSLLTNKNIFGNSPIRVAVKTCTVEAISLLGDGYGHLQESVRDEFFRYKESLLVVAVETNNALVVRKVLELYYGKAYKHWDDCILEAGSVLGYGSQNYPNSVREIMRFYIDNPQHASLKVLYHIIQSDNQRELLNVTGSKRKSFYHLLVEVGADHVLLQTRLFHYNAKTTKRHNLLHTFALSRNPTVQFLKALHTKIGDERFVTLIDERCVNGTTPVQYLETNDSEEVKSCLQYMREVYGIASATEF